MEGTSHPRVLRPQPRRPAPSQLSLTPISTSEEASPNEHSPGDPSSEPEYIELKTGRKTNDHDSTSAKTRTSDPSTDRLQAHQKSRSISNLTSSTLFGIYSPSGYEPNRDEPFTPFGTGAQTPARGTNHETRKGLPVFTAETFHEKAAIGEERRRERSKSMQQQMSWTRRSGIRSHTGHVAARIVLLFVFGISYGEVITRLHDTGRVAPVQVERIDRSSWLYLTFWGLTGVTLGVALPYLDGLRGSRPCSNHGHHDVGTQSKQDVTVIDDDEDYEHDSHAAAIAQPGSLATDWSDIVRCVGAFVGIAFAIRKLSWQSTLQVSLTLALVNPAIWYLIDRTRTGFLLSSGFGMIGALVLLSTNPNWIPAPATGPPPSVGVQSMLATPADTAGVVPGHARQQWQTWLANTVSYESVGVATWVSSVLFCSCIFFGNIGRRLWAR